MAVGKRPFEHDEERIDMRPLWRLLAWGVSAAVALMLAVFVSRSDVGERRVALALAARSETADPARAAAHLLAKADDSEREAQHLAEVARTLAAERDRLTARVTALEQSLEDLTGSISLTQPARRPASAALWPALPGFAGSPWDEPPRPPATLPVNPDQGASAPSPPPSDPPVPSQRADADEPAVSAAPAEAAAPPEIPLPRPNPLAALRVANVGDLPDTAAKPRLGVDLGGASSVEGLRTLWGQIKESQAELVGDLRPLIAVRDGSRPGAVQLRLIAGPVASSAAATRLCAALGAAGIVCRATAFDGQRLAER
jgi:hypothetical protein